MEHKKCDWTNENGGLGKSEALKGEYDHSKHANKSQNMGIFSHDNILPFTYDIIWQRGKQLDLVNVQPWNENEETNVVKLRDRCLWQLDSSLGQIEQIIVIIFKMNLMVVKS